MKKIIKGMLCIIALFVLLTAPQSVSAKTGKGISIEKTFAKGMRDEIKRKVYDKNQDGYLSKKEIKHIKKIDLYSRKNLKMQENINIKGISKLKYLEKMSIEADGKIYNLKETEKLYRLKYIKIYANLKRNRVLDFRKSKKLETLNITIYDSQIKIPKNNKIRTLRLIGIQNSISILKNCKQVKKVWIEAKNIKKSIKLRKRKNLSEIHFIAGVKVDNLEISDCNKLEKIEIRGGEVNNCNIKNNNKTKSIEIVSVNKLSSIKLCNMSKLKKIDIENVKKLKTLTIENTPRLKNVTCMNGMLSELNITGKNSIGEMWLCNNRLTKFEYNNLEDLYSLFINNNQLQGKFDMTLYPSLYRLYCPDNKISILYGGVAEKEIWYINCENNNLSLIDFRGTKNGCILGLDCKNNPNVVIYATVEDGSWDSTAKVYGN